MGHSNLYATSFYCTSILIWNDSFKNINITFHSTLFNCALIYYLQHNDLSLGYTLSIFSFFLSPLDTYLKKIIFLKILLDSIILIAISNERYSTVINI